MTTTMRRYEENEKCADILDAGRQHVEREVFDEVRRIQAQANKVDAVAIGECLCCGEPFSETDRRRWCDDKCRDEWQHLKERRKLNTKGKR